MSTTSDDKSNRLQTGVAGLDAVLHGGFLRGAMYLITGGSGTGKTVLSSQIAFKRAAAGENVLYITSFTESHGRMLSNLDSFSFFDRSLIQRRITLLSGVSALEEGGLERFQEMVSEAVRTHRASLLIIDSLTVASELAPTPFAYRKFLRGLGALLSLMNCTALLITSQKEAPDNLEQVVADGILELDQQLLGMRLMREVVVSKYRGSSHLEGKHVFDIGVSGITVHPRREALLLHRELANPPLPSKSRFGIPGLDDMLHGGVPSASVTALLGPAGSGKTLLGLYLLDEGLRQGEPCLYFGFYEMPPRLLAKAEGVGLRLHEHTASGLLEVQWRQPTEQLLDPLAEHILEIVHRQKVQRLFIDGVDGMIQASAHPERFSSFFAGLSNELRSLGVSSATSVETSLSGSESCRSAMNLSATVENIIFMRYVELRAQLHRIISIRKVRESDYDPSLREFRITPLGFEVAGSSESADSVLDQLTSGRARASARAPNPPHASSPSVPETSGEDV